MTRAIVTVSRLPTVDRAQRDLATSLMEFLQRICFVGSKGRELAATANARIARAARDAQSLGGMRTYIGVLRRAMEVLERSAVSSRPSAVSHAPAVAHQPSLLLRASGFARVEIRYSAAVRDHMKMKSVNAAIGYRS